MKIFIHCHMETYKHLMIIDYKTVYFLIIWICLLQTDHVENDKNMKEMIKKINHINQLITKLIEKHEGKK